MDILSRLLKPISAAPPGARTVTDQGTAWPKIKAVHGKYYIFTDAHKDSMVAQTRETWEALGTVIEQQRVTMRSQDSAIKMQSDEIRRLQSALSDANTKLETLRSNHRVLLKERVEAAMVPTPGASDAPAFDIFSTPPKD